MEPSEESKKFLNREDQLYGSIAFSQDDSAQLNQEEFFNQAKELIDHCN